MEGKEGCDSKGNSYLMHNAAGGLWVSFSVSKLGVGENTFFSTLICLQMRHFSLSHGIFVSCIYLGTRCPFSPTAPERAEMSPQLH